MILNILAVAAGGAAGSVLRYLFTLIPVKSVFPFQTFVVNMLGCFAIGAVTTLASLAAQKVSFRFSPLVVLFLKTGVCGALRFFKFDFGNSVRDGRSKLHPLGKWILQGQKSVLFIIYSQNYLTRYLLKCVFLKQGRCSVDF